MEKYRITVDKELYLKILSALTKQDVGLADEVGSHTKACGATVKQHRALLETADKKRRKTEAKIENAVRLLLLEEKEPTVYRVAKTAGISYNTAKKYEKDIEYYARTTSLYSMN